MFKIIVFFSLFAPILAVNLGVHLKLWMVLGFVLILFNIKNIKISIFEVILLSILLIIALSSLRSNITSTQAIYIFFAPFQIAIAIYLSRFFNEQVFYKFIYTYLAATFIYGLYGILIMPSSTLNNDIYGGVFMQFGIPRLSGFVGDPNILSFYLCLFIFLSYYFNYKKFIPFLVIFVLLTLSRTGIIVLAILGLVAALEMNKRSSKSYLMFFVLAILTITLSDFSQNYFFGYYRFDGVSVESLGGRTILWSYALNYIINNPFQGIGLGGSRAFIETTYGTFTFPHNTFIEFILELGIPLGFIMIGLIFIPIFAVTKKLSLIIVYLIIMCAFMTTLSLSVNEALWFVVGILFKKWRENDLYRKHR